MGIFDYWGKTVEDGRYHLLPYHCLDVAAVGWLLLDPHKSLCRHLAAQLGVEPVVLQRWASFFFCLHDLGKFASAFQGLVPGLSPDLVTSRLIYTERHDSLGYLLWDDNDDGLFFKAAERGAFPTSGQRQLRRTLRAWMQIVTGHHGIPPKTGQIDLANHFTLQDREAALTFLLAIHEFFLSDTDAEILNDKELCRRLNLVSWTLAGIVVLADWLGSGRPAERYVRHSLPLQEYWRDHAMPFAVEAVAAARIENSPIAPYAGARHLFPFIDKLTPLQHWATERELADTQQLFILEDVTGAGKTEASLILAHRLMANGLADGIYVALPTMATANAMYERLRRAYKGLYARDASPSLTLAHGARHLSADFRLSLIPPENRHALQTYGLGEEPIEAFCSDWLADSRKKALLSEVGVGTIDQALLAVLPTRHQSLRCLGLTRKVLIVDEVHSYDPYMNHLLRQLLVHHAAQGGSAILLSATLPFAMRSDYLNAFAEGAKLSPPELFLTDAYPLATHIPAAEPPETALAPRREVERTLTVSLLDSPDNAMEIIRLAVEQGKCVCWVRNTVADAIQAFRLLRRKDWIEKDRLMLFHSRFAMIDRQRIESATLKCFGKDSDAEMRRGLILIATQVVEQSLDLDFDVMISDLAPIDLLIQRAGRQHRHVRDSAGNRIDEEGARDRREPPVFYVLGPPPTEDPAEAWLKTVLPGTQAIYQHVGQLWLTQQILTTGRLSMPGDARAFIEGVYGDAAQRTIPSALEPLTWKALGEDSGKLSMAHLNVLNLGKGYCRESSGGGGWEDEARVPTRLGDDSIRIALVVPDGAETWRPYADVEAFSWELSMLSVPKSRWQKAWEAMSPEIRTSLATFREEYKVLKWVELFPLTTELSDWYDEQLGWGLYKEVDNESD
ncbi:CRISPR-associated helicase Cas3' [Geoalkalibacter halelectricus]|uniref:CRISPR-associated helicase Cas3' n=1 Tax=Geoalkalibacter halelectricus TaxID=2847045 RepID=UPI003D24B6F9